MAEHSPCTARGETPLQRADRNFVELLQELRVTQTGVQILFAFLLSLAFTSRFSSLDTAQRVTYVSTLLLAVLAAALFTAPAALHRSLFQQGAKPRIVQVSSRLATTGLIVLVFAFSGSVLLVVDVTTGRAGGIAAGGRRPSWSASDCGACSPGWCGGRGCGRRRTAAARNRSPLSRRRHSKAPSRSPHRAGEDRRAERRRCGGGDKLCGDGGADVGRAGGSARSGAGALR
ncbi:hypothetical protein GCM10011428_41090 [Streptomyces violaceus]